MWNVPRLFHYSLDHLKRQFDDEKIHPAIVLAVARKNGIPTLIKPAVDALTAIPLHSWCCDEEILCHVAVEEVGVIARMKERLYLICVALLDVPPVIHDEGCGNGGDCARAWELHWHMRVGKRLRQLSGTASNSLWWIRTEEVIKAQVPGMGLGCLSRTVTNFGDSSCWLSEMRVIDGAIDHLMVSERIPDWPGITN
jgi:hypothetical protein